MILNHPGCNNWSAGKNYDSEGKYHKGCTGRCGKIVKGWYVMCVKCRNKYKKKLAQLHAEVKQQIPKDTTAEGNNQIPAILTGKKKFKLSKA